MHCMSLPTACYPICKYCTCMKNRGVCMLITQLNKTGMQVKTIQKLLDHILLYAQLLLTEMVDFKKKRVKNKQVSISRKLHDYSPYEKCDVSHNISMTSHQDNSVSFLMNSPKVRPYWLFRCMQRKMCKLISMMSNSNLKSQTSRGLHHDLATNIR